MESRVHDWKVDGPVSTLIFFLVRLSQFFSVAHRLHTYLTKPKRQRRTSPNFDTWFYGIYVLVWLGALLVILVYLPLKGNLGLAWASLALYRLQDMLFGTIGDAFRFDTINGTGSSKVMLAVFNVFQIVVIFAIVFYVLLPDQAFMPRVPSGRFGHLFLSWSTLPPLGSGVFAKTTRARSLVMVESGAGILVTVVALGRFLSAPDLGNSGGAGLSDHPESVAESTQTDATALVPDYKVAPTDRPGTPS